MQQVFYIIAGRALVNISRWLYQRYRAWSAERMVRGWLTSMEARGESTEKVREELNQAYGTDL